MDLSRAIESIRKEKRISKAEMAKMLDMDPSNYSRLEGRSDKLTIEQTSQIANALGVTLVDLLSWGEDKQPKPNQPDVDRLKLDVDSLKLDVDKSNELIKYQREKIKYLQSTCTELIVEMAFANYDIEGKVVTKQDPDSGELDYAYPEDDWLEFLTEFLVSDDWAFELLERGITDEKAVLSFDIGNDTSTPVPKNIKRKQRKRLTTRLRNMHD